MEGNEHNVKYSAASDGRFEFRRTCLRFVPLLIVSSALQYAAVEAAPPPASAELTAARQQYQFLIEQAYQRHPAIPVGLLESQAYVATRWQHRVPADGERHLGMPPSFGLFGLYATNDHGFVDLLGEVAEFNGLSRQALMSDVETYIFATAAFLEDYIRSRGLEDQSIESYRPVVAMLSGIAATSEAARYAVNTHVYEVYKAAGQGIEIDPVTVQPRRVDLGKVFTADELENLGAEAIVIDLAADQIEVKKKRCAFP